MLKSTLLKSISTAAFLFASLSALAAPFAQAPLPYAANALEPVIDAKTMEIHHGRHHLAYVNNLNAQLENFPKLEELSLEQIMQQISSFNLAVRNNGGGHYNHQFFWQLMAPVGQGGAPSATLTAAIERDFGSLDALKTAFNQAAASRFGSGWAWVIVNKDGKLQVTSTPNQDNPLMDVVEERGTPILALDVWEHAYYLAYQNRRGDYSQAWWQLVNWNKVNQLFEQAVTKKQPK